MRNTDAANLLMLLRHSPVVNKLKCIHDLCYIISLFSYICLQNKFQAFKQKLLNQKIIKIIRSVSKGLTCAVHFKDCLMIEHWPEQYYA